MMMSPLYQTNMLKFNSYSASSLKQQTTGRHVAPLVHIIMIQRQPVFALTPQCCMLGKVTNTYFTVLGLTPNSSSNPSSTSLKASTQLQLKPIIYLTQGQHTNHYTTDAFHKSNNVLSKLYYYYNEQYKYCQQSWKSESSICRQCNLNNTTADQDHRKVFLQNVKILKLKQAPVLLIEIFGGQGQCVTCLNGLPFTKIFNCWTYLSYLPFLQLLCVEVLIIKLYHCMTVLYHTKTGFPFLPNIHQYSSIELLTLCHHHEGFVDIN